MTLTPHVRPPKTPAPARLAATCAGLLLLLVGCNPDMPYSTVETSSSAPAGSSTPAVPDTANADHPDVVAASLQRDDDGSWTLEVTLSSAYDSPERYADGWRVMDKDGEVLGQHTLTHDHADEQPVTRAQSGLQIPDDVDEVTVEGKDTENGYGGATLAVQVPR